MKTIHRYEVPVDGQWHEHKLTGHILHVECRNIDVIEFWAHHIEGNPAETVQLRVYGTGHDIPIASVYCGTAIAPGGQLVWHLVQAVDAELYEQTTVGALVPAAAEQ